jgi:hypothetical protein
MIVREHVGLRIFYYYREFNVNKRNKEIRKYHTPITV